MCFPLLGQGLIPFPLAPVSSTQVPSLLCECHPEKPLPSPGHWASCWHAPSRRMHESHQMDNSRGAQQHFSLIGCGHSLPALGPPGMHPASHAAPAPAWRARLRTCRSLLRMLLVPWRMHAVSKVEPWVSRAMQRQRHESLGAVGQMCLGHSGLNPLLCAQSPQPALRASMVGKFLPGCTCPVPVCPLPCGTQGPHVSGGEWAMLLRVFSTCVHRGTSPAGCWAGQGVPGPQAPLGAMGRVVVMQDTSLLCVRCALSQPMCLGTTGLWQIRLAGLGPICQERHYNLNHLCTQAIELCMVS